MNAVVSPSSPKPLPLVARLVLVDADTLEARLEALARTGRLEAVPNTWQIFLGVLRMWHRMLFRSHTVGTSSHPVRPGLRAKLFAYRPLRFPFLLREKAIAPLDFSGLLSSRERVVSHLLGAHHDANQFVYDLEMLSLFAGEDGEGGLEELFSRARRIAESDDARARYLRDLVVYEGYHRQLVEAVADALRGVDRLSDEERADPDISFRAYLAWCARQPKTPDETLAMAREGRFTIAGGVR